MRLLRWLSAHFATPRLLIEIVAIVVALYGIDQFLASLENRELGTEARHDFEHGQKLLKQGRASEAVELFRHAHVEDRDNRTYSLALADAYLADHEPERAQNGLEDMLASDSNDAQANLRMARVMSQEGSATRADSFYHRAIYGAWPPHDVADRTAARLELANWLAGKHQDQELLSELLLLDQAARTNAPVAAQLPTLYVQAGAPERAEVSYHALIRSKPGDPAIYAGLGAVELSRGNFRGARESFEQASRLAPQDQEYKQETRIAGRALDLDPTPRHLASAEKLARSTSILELVSQSAQNCTTVEPSVRQTANTILGNRAEPVTNEASEMRLEAAEEIWHQLPPSCIAHEDADLIAALMHKIAQ